jgi:hypothetical protein
MLHKKILIASLAAFLAAHAHAQTNNGLKPITVCDVFASRLSLNGKYISLIARLESTFEGRWLGDERCPNEVKLDGHKWPTQISLEYDPSGQTVFAGPMVIDWDDVNSKFLDLKKTNKQRYDSDHWVIVYGRIETQRKLKTGSRNGEGGNGYGHQGASPVQLVFRPNDIKYFLPKESRWLP